MIRTNSSFDKHEMLICITHEPSGLEGYIAIHNTNLGPALGGTRLQAYGSDEQVLEDALRLSKAMTYKCALANLPYGGGKGVINASKIKDRQKALEMYAKFVDRLAGTFKTGTDVGITDEDVGLMGKYSHNMLGLAPGDRGELSTAATAALGVFSATKATLKELYGDASFAGKTLAIKGVGKLGGDLARDAVKAGARVYIADIDDAKCQALAEESDQIKVVPLLDIHRQAVDIYAPCALGNEFTPKVVDELNCKAIVGGANNQLPDQAAGEAIFGKGILYAPDYIANAGGLIYVADELEEGGFKHQRVLERVEAIQTTLQAIFERSKHDHLPTDQVADMIARERIDNQETHA